MPCGAYRFSAVGPQYGKYPEHGSSRDRCIAPRVPGESACEEHLRAIKTFYRGPEDD